MKVVFNHKFSRAANLSSVKTAKITYRKNFRIHSMLSSTAYVVHMHLHIDKQWHYDAYKECCSGFKRVGNDKIGID